MRRRLLPLLSALAILGTLTAAPPAYAAVPLPTTLEVKTDRTTLSPEHPTATITGTLKATSAGEEPKPVAGRKVKLTGASGSGWTAEVVTSADGSFKATYTSLGHPGPVHADSPADTEYAAAQADTAPITIRQAGTRMTLSSKPPRPDQGRSTTLTGRVEWKATTWRPLEGAKVTVTVPRSTCDAKPRQTTTTTNAQGDYSVKVTLACNTSISASAASPTGLYKPTTAKLADLKLRPRVRLTLKIQMDPYGNIQASGGLHPQLGSYTYTGQTVILERSPNGQNAWRTHRKLPVRNNAYSAKFTVAFSAHWRARYAGGPNGQASQSRVHRLLRWQTQVSRITASPIRVRVGGNTTVRGSLSRFYNSQQPKPTAFPNVNVRILFRFRGEGAWYHLAWARTNRTGHFSKPVTAHGDGFYAVVFQGTRDTWASGSPNQVYVDTFGQPISLGPPTHSHGILARWMSRT